MVRGKTQMKRIENASNRHVTFSKRRNGLLKKALELSVLCDVEVALLVFSAKGKLYEFASASMHETIERYKRHTKNTRVGQPSIEEDIEHWKDEAAHMTKKIELLEDSKRKLLGEGLCSCTIEELQKIEKQLENSVSSIRARKAQVYKEQIAKLKEKEKTLKSENAVLSMKCRLAPIEGASKPREIFRESSASSEVETELFIGPPKTSLTLVPYNCQK